MMAMVVVIMEMMIKKIVVMVKLDNGDGSDNQNDSDSDRSDVVKWMQKHEVVSCQRTADRLNDSAVKTVQCCGFTVKPGVSGLRVTLHKGHNAAEVCLTSLN